MPESDEVRDALLTDLAAGALSPWRAWKVRRKVASDPEWREAWLPIQALFQVARTLPAPPPGPRPDWPAPSKGKSMQRRLLLPGLAAASICLVSALPVTRSLVRGQLEIALGGGPRILQQIQGASPNPAPEPTDRAGRLRKLLLEIPWDYAPDYQSKARAYLAKIDREVREKPNEPLFRAVQLHTELLLLGKAPNPSYDPLVLPQAPISRPVKPGDVERFLRDTHDAEKRFPDNALFPLLRASGLFRLKRTEEALEAFATASNKPVWDAYMPSFYRYATAGEDGSLGFVGSFLPRTMAESEDYGVRRTAPWGTAWFVILEACRREKMGAIDDGLALRESVLALAEKDLSLAHLASVARTAPGGEGAKEPPASLGSSEIREARQKEANARFRSFVTTHGKPELADRADRILADTPAKRREETYAKYAASRTYPVVFGALAAQFVLLSAVWLVLTGGIAYLLSRTRTVRLGEPRPLAFRWGVGLAGAAPLLWGLAMQEPLFLAGLAALPIGATLHLLRRDGLSNFGKNALTAIKTALGTLGIVGLAGGVMAGSQFFDAGSGAGDGLDSLLLMGPVMGAASLALPTLTALVLGVQGARRGTPAGVAAVRGMRRVALPAACVCLLVYSIGIGWIGVQDARLCREIDAHALQN